MSEILPTHPRLEAIKATVPQNIPQEYFEAVGRFVVLFSALEGLIFTTVGAMSGAPPPMARAVFSSLRTNGATQMLNRVVAAREEILSRKNATDEQRQHILTLHKYLNRMFEQLSVINGRRNNIVHLSQATGELGQPIFSNWVRELRLEKLIALAISKEDIEAMLEDISTIMFGLAAIQEVDAGAFKLSPEGVKLLEAEWKYKPPKPILPEKERSAGRKSDPQQR